MFYTYFHTRNDTGAVFYVGKGQRKRAHSSTNRNQHWSRIVAKHGHTVHVAAEWPTEAEAFEHEKFLIACFRDIGVGLCNMTDGGEGATPSAEVCEKIRLALIGKKASVETRERISRALTGKKRSLATKERISEASRSISEETRRKRSVAATGRKLSDATREKLRLANTGKSMSPENKAKLLAVNVGNNYAKKPIRVT